MVFTSRNTKQCVRTKANSEKLTNRVQNQCVEEKYNFRKQVDYLKCIKQFLHFSFCFCKQLHQFDGQYSMLVIHSQKYM